MNRISQKMANLRLISQLIEKVSFTFLFKIYNYYKIMWKNRNQDKVKKVYASFNNEAYEFKTNLQLYKIKLDDSQALMSE